MTRKMRMLIWTMVILLVAGMVFVGCGSKKADSTKTETTESKQEDKDAGSNEADKAEGEEKTVKIVVTHKDESKKEFEYTTTAKMLGDMLTEEGLVEGIEGEAGLYITTVDGEKAEDKNQEWWMITKGGEMTEVGADSLELADGDTYELTFTVGYY